MPETEESYARKLLTERAISAFVTWLTLIGDNQD